MAAGVPVHLAVRSRCRRHPDAVAVLTSTEKVSYRELDDRIDELARALGDAGVRPGDRVAIAVPREPDLLASMLAVLHLGAAYIPLDPSHPAERIDGILANARPRVVLTTRTTPRGHDSLLDNAGQLLLLEAVEAAPNDRRPTAAVDPGDVAYVIYTSGSTGQPKGVTVTHHALTNLLDSMSEDPGLPERAAFPAITTVSFDISAVELFLPLLRGGTVVLADDDQARDPELLADLVERSGARQLQATPVTWRMLLDAGWQPPAGFHAWCGGERLPRELGERMCAAGMQVTDLYGPTETTIWSSLTSIAAGGPRDFRPVARTSVLVLSERLEPVPAGELGQVYLGGAGLALGYHEKPALTADRFLPDPFATESGARLFRTGDVARLHLDGRVEVLGRDDDQLKIRGFRVEPGDVEAALVTHPAVRAAAVRGLPAPSGELQLVAFVLARSPAAPPAASALRQHCAALLPDYLVPARVVVLDAFPTTPHGKIDRSALVAPAVSPAPAAGSAPDPGRSPTERAVLAVFAEALRSPAIGRDADFFEHGGDSLLAVAVVNSLRRSLTRSVSVSAVFRHRTAARLAAAIDAEPASHPGDREPQHQQTTAAPLSFAQQRLWILHQLEPGSTAYLEPLVITFTERVDLDRLTRALEATVRRHDALRTRFVTDANGLPRPVLEDVPDLRITVQDADVETALGHELAHPIDLERHGPLRARLVRSAGTADALVLVVHHIATDDRSHRVIAEDLLAAYRGAALEPLPADYLDFARAERASEHRRGLDYWTGRLSGTGRADVAWHPEPADPSAQPGSVFADLPAEVMDRISTTVAAGATSFMTLLTAVYLVTARRTERRDVVLGVPVSVRADAEFDRVVGNFVNTIALRVRLPRNLDFAASLEAVRTAAEAAYDHATTPFDLVVDALAPQRSPRRNPLFSTMVTMHGAASTPDLANLAREAKMDLSWHLFTRPEGGIDLRLDHSAGVPEATAHQLVEEFREVLVTASLPAPSGEQSGAAERDAGDQSVTDPINVLTAVIAHAVEDPDACALIEGARRISFGELVAAARQQAEALRALGVVRGDVVLVELEHCGELVSAMLGTWLAGAAYVPVDPTHPEPRRREIYRDSGARVLLSEATDPGPLTAPGVRRLAPVVVSSTGDTDTVLSAEPAEDIDPAALAYVVYTSGSTGRPKGVMVTHGGLASYCAWAIRTLQPERGSGSPLHSSIAYDLGLTALFPTLAAGAPVRLLRSVANDVGALAAALGEDRHSFVKLTPTHLDLLEATLEVGTAAPSIPALVIAGEPLRGEQLARWRHEAPRTRVINSYGPTEVTIACAAHVTEAGVVPDGPLPIGTAIAGAGLRLLDEHLAPCPDDQVAELYVAGPGLARGYLGQPGLTAASFLPDPFGPPGSRLYRTGDLVSRGPTGLHFVGRVDDQVKIRGHRVEPAEAQAQLAAHRGVAAAVVLPVGDADDRRLAAYVVRADDSLTPGDLRSYLRERLPDHAVPSQWALLSRIPLLGNGKVDREALPAAQPIDAPAHDDDDDAQTVQQRVIADIWCSLLKLDRVGAHDNFFDLGGNSLLAARVVARLRDQLSTPATLKDLFQAPTVAGLAVRLDAGAGSAGARPVAPEPSGPTIPRADRSVPLPLSSAQRRFYFLDQLRPDSTDYLVSTAWRLSGELDLKALERALDRLIQRHEILRTRYLQGSDTEPMQVIDSPAPVTLAVEDGEPGLVVAEELARPIDLANGPVLRARLVRVDPHTHVFVLVLHHIATDARTSELLLAELDTGYRGESAALPPVQYADAAAWLGNRRDAAHDAEDLDFWRRQLDGVVPTELHADRRSETGSPDGQSLRFVIDPTVADRLFTVGSEVGATPFMTLYAGFVAVLSRWTRSTDIVTGTPVSGRVDGTEDVLGPFLNTVVLRTAVDDDPRFDELVVRVRDMIGDAYQHSGLPFERVVEELAPGRDLHRNPMFQIMFLLREGAGAGRIGDLEADLEPAPPQAAKLDLTVELTPRLEGGYDGDLRFAADRFDPATMEQFVNGYRLLLEQASERSDARIGAHRILDEQHAAALLGASRGATATRGEEGLAERIFAQATRSPRSLAVEDGTERMDYATLARLAEDLAEVLRGAGVEQDDVVGIHLPRGADLVVAVLATLGAGAAFVLLDPAHPAARTAWVLADADPRVVISHANEVPGSERRTILAPRGVASPTGARSDIPSGVPGEALAYLCYTSGSTGRPKGAAITVRGITNRVLWAVERFGIGAGDRMLNKTATTFDAVVWELLAPLVAGGVVVAAPPGIELDPAAVVTMLADRRITILQAVPTWWREIGAQPALAECSSLRLLFSAGERLSVDLAERLCAALPGAALVNTYGPTECAVDVTAHVYRTERSAAVTATVPIGQPIANLRVAVVAADGELTPLGVPGELLLSGPALARGYLGQPGLTAERFVPDRFGPPGERAYRTGDLVRWTAAGVLEFLGRLDEQLKVRGVRIEPAEVEAAIATHPEVSAAAVAARTGPDGHPQLVAFTVGAATPASLRRHLTAALPSPWMPSVFVELDDLPLTATGKIDRTALPEVASGSRPAGRAAPARTRAQRAVAAVFEDLLDVTDVTLDDDFFALGGHSFLASRVVDRLAERAGTRLPVSAIFESPGVAALAERLHDPDPADQAIDADGYPPRPPGAPARMSFAQERMWFLHRIDPFDTSYHLTWSTELDGPLDVEVLERALSALLERHPALRTRYAASADGSGRQIVEDPRPAELRVIRIDPGEDPRELLDRLSAEPFDLAAAAPVRMRLIRRSETSHLLVVAMHHIAVDAWSETLLARELSVLYAVAVTGLAPLPLGGPSYLDYSALQRRRMESGHYDTALRAWRERLHHLPSTGVPPDRPRPPVRDTAGAALDFTIPAEVARPLLDVGRAHGATPFVTFYAVFAAMLGRYTTETDIVIGTPVSGREDSRFDHVVGLFVNTLVLRLSLADAPTFAKVLARARDTALDAFAHQDLPFNLLVNGLEPRRDQSRGTLFDIMLDVRDGRAELASPPGLTARRIERSTTTAKFDLALTVTVEVDGSCSAQFEYATALYDRSTMARLAQHFVNLARGAGSDPDRRTDRIALLGPAEMEQVVQAGLGVTVPVGTAAGSSSPEPTVPEAILSVAGRTPEATAVVDGETELTYADLATRALELARRLRDRGVATDRPVAVLLDRSLDAVVGWLAVLVAGGCYVPMDPKQPRQRVHALLDDLRPAVILASTEHGALAAGRPEQLIEIDSDTEAPTMRVESSGLVGESDPASLAYMLYTSGSTGHPKAVMVPHGAYAHHCRRIAETYQIDERARVVQLAAPTFDVAMDQLGATLISGAAVVVGPRTIWSPEELPSRLAEAHVTHMEITPAYYRELMRVLPPGDDRLDDLRLMNVGSDVVTYADVDRWAATGLPARFLATYGPTEATITCLTHQPDTSESAQRPAENGVPLGRPVPGTHVYVMGDQGDLRPFGVPGELYVGGERVARGYHGRAALTAERFVPDPFCPGARAYRTGDLARMRENGEIEFLGRVDDQVKIRGFRVEPGEIEAHLAAMDGVGAACVSVRELIPGDPQLVAYLTPQSGDAPDLNRLRRALREEVPEYMVPAYWVGLDTLPMTVSGKVDRRALPDPDLNATSLPARIAPRDEVETAIAQAWAEVLPGQDVGVEDDFFDVGGHSLLLTRVGALIGDLFGLEVPLRLLFDHRTVASQARALARMVDDPEPGGGALDSAGPGSPAPQDTPPEARGMADESHGEQSHG